jgi:hypothetical protein
MLIAHDAAPAMLTGNLPPFPIKGIAIAVARRATELADMPILIEPAHLDRVGDVTPHEEFAYTIPGRPFRPKHARVEPLDRRVPNLGGKPLWVMYDHIWFRIG